MASLPVHQVQQFHQVHLIQHAQQVQHWFCNLSRTRNKRRRGRRNVDTPRVDCFPTQPRQFYVQHNLLTQVVNTSYTRIVQPRLRMYGGTGCSERFKSVSCLKLNCRGRKSVARVVHPRFHCARKAAATTKDRSGMKAAAYAGVARQAG